MNAAAGLMGLALFGATACGVTDRVPNYGSGSLTFGGPIAGSASQVKVVCDAGGITTTGVVAGYPFTMTVPSDMSTLKVTISGGNTYKGVTAGIRAGTGGDLAVAGQPQALSKDPDNSNDGQTITGSIHCA